MGNVKLGEELIRAVLRSKRDREPVPVSGWEVVEALWPLNDLFRPNLELIRSMKYESQFGNEVDSALEAAARAGSLDSLGEMSAQAWRVFLERHQQMLVVAMANEIAQNPITLLPMKLTGVNRTLVVALFFLHSMTLPEPPADRSRLGLPEGGPGTSLRRH